MLQPYIVGEVSVNWPQDQPGQGLLSIRFEHIILVNAARGYRLHSWKFNTMMAGKRMVETTIAVFELAEVKAPA